MEKPESQATVVLLRDGLKRVCLARKKQRIHHSVGEIPYSLGVWNGYGGKSESEDDSIFHTAIRELRDESEGVRGNVTDLELVLRVHFYVKDKETSEHIPFMTVSFFFLDRWFGTPAESLEMGPPMFFDREDIPYDEMMPADKVLLEKMFAGEKGVYEVKLNGKTSPPEIRELEEVLVW